MLWRARGSRRRTSWQPRLGFVCPTQPPSIPPCLLPSVGSAGPVDTTWLQRYRQRDVLSPQRNSDSNFGVEGFRSGEIEQVYITLPRYGEDSAHVTKPVRATQSRTSRTVLHDIFALMRNRVLEHFETVASSRIINSRVMVVRTVHKVREIFAQTWAKTSSLSRLYIAKEDSI